MLDDRRQGRETGGEIPGSDAAGLALTGQQHHPVHEHGEPRRRPTPSSSPAYHNGPEGRGNDRGWRGETPNFLADRSRNYVGATTDEKAFGDGPPLPSLR